MSVAVFMKWLQFNRFEKYIEPKAKIFSDFRKFEKSIIETLVSY